MSDERIEPEEEREEKSDEEKAKITKEKFIWQAGDFIIIRKPKPDQEEQS